MAEIVALPSRSEALAREALKEFIRYCKEDLQTFGADLDFDSHIWDVTASTGAVRRHRKNIRFVRQEREHHLKWNVPFCEPFCSFAKAYVRERWSRKQKGAVDAQLRALRALHEVLVVEGVAEIVRINGDVLSRAAKFLAETGNVATAYTAGSELEQIARLLDKAHLTSGPVSFSNWLPRPEDGSSRVGDEFEKRRNAKLPSAATLNAVGQLFGLAVEPGDVMVTSVLAILCSAPDRINEVLSLRRDCEVENPIGGPAAYGLRWYPAKGGAPTVKWVSEKMVPVVKQAIRSLRELSKKAHEICLWYERHPDRIYLWPELEHLRSQEWLSLKEIAAIYFSTPVARTVPLMWCRGRNVPYEVIGTGREQRTRARFSDVEKAVLAELPIEFPVLDRRNGLKYSDALCLFQVNAFHAKKTVSNCSIEPLSHSHVYTRLKSVEGQPSIFARFGFTEDDGTEIDFSSHKLRHYLNTLAQSKDLGQLDIQMWSGRRQVKQNANYDHVSASQMLAKIRDSLGNDVSFSNTSAMPQKLSPISFADFLRLRAPTVHMTDIGGCTHDFVMSPCPMHRDHVNCDEQFCIKGDEKKCARLREMRDETARLVGTAEAAESQGQYGASRWLEHQRVTLKRLNNIVAILDDPRVPNGAVIRLSSKSSGAVELQKSTTAVLGADTQASDK